MQPSGGVGMKCVRVIKTSKPTLQPKSSQEASDTFSEKTGVTSKDLTTCDNDDETNLIPYLVALVG